MSDVLGITELGMINDMNRLNVISNNLANVNTTGFKREIPVSRAFESTFINQFNAGQIDLSSSATTNKELATAVVDHSVGSFKYTGNKFDIAIEGEGFLEVSGKGGKFYTRQGALTIDEAGRLMMSSGYIVNGMGGEIRITSSEPRIDKQGRIWDGENQAGQLKVVNFTNPRELSKAGSGLYKADGVQSEIMDEKSIRIRQGYLESSNVVQMNEMVNMIEVTRHFEMSQRLVKSYDELMDNTIRTLGDF